MQDLREAMRGLRAAPVVSAVAVLSLALGIGANATIFAIVNGLVLRPLPVRDPQRLVSVQQQGDDDSAWTYPIWEQVRQRAALFAGAAAWSRTRLNLAARGEAEFAEGLYVSGEFFELLGVPAILGRALTPSDDRPGGEAVAVIGYGFWQSRFDGAGDVVGRTIILERTPFMIVGVTPPSFFGPEVGRRFDVAVPFGAEPLLRAPSRLDQRSFWWLSIWLRLRPDQTIEAATTALRGVQPRIREATQPPGRSREELERFLAAPFTLQDASAGASAVRARYQRPVVTLLIIVGLVLLIACANIANLMLARATARRHELVVRRALGASRVRLVRQLLAESLLLSVAGAALGVIAARWAAPPLVQQLSTEALRIVLDLTVDWRVIGFTAAATMVTALVFGTAPAIRAAALEPSEVLKEGARGIAGERRLGFGGILVVSQVALSLVLIVGAGLFVGTFARLAATDPGFDTGRVIAVSVNAQRSAVRPDARMALYERLRDAAAAVPGVADAAASVVSPVAGMAMVFDVTVPGGPALSERERTVYVNVVTPRFFRTYGTRLLAGRDFGRADQVNSPPVAIVNEAFARRFMNGGNPVGRAVVHQSGGRAPATSREIVGYVQDAVYQNLRQAVPPTLYIPLNQSQRDPFVTSGIIVSARAADGPPALLTRSLAAALAAVDPDVALTFRPLADQVRGSLAQERLVAMVSAAFGGLGLLLAGLGLYGVTAYSVSRRRSEIGIRLALGADPAVVVRMVLRRVASLVAAGIVLGALTAAWAARLAVSLLHGIEPGDPRILVGASLLLASVAVVAGWLPARRAARISPTEVLREV